MSWNFHSSLSSVALRISELGAAPDRADSKTRPQGGSPNDSAWHIQCEYLEALQSLETAAAAAMISGELRKVASSGELSAIVGLAMKHISMNESMSLPTMQSWFGVLSVLTLRTRNDTSLSHFIPQVVTVVKALSKDRSSSPRSGLLYGALSLLRILMLFSPADISLSLRQIPHPVKTIDVAPRVAAMHVLPILVAETTCRKTRLIDMDTFLYLRKGMECVDFAVREAAVEASRTLFAMGLGLEELVAPVALEALMGVCEDVSYTSLKLQEDAGIAIGCVLALAQAGPGKPLDELASAGITSVKWDFFGGTTMSDATRATKRILRTPMMRTTQQVLSIALAEMLRRTVVADTMHAALTQLMQLIVPTKQDARAYMPRLVSRGIERWSETLMSDTLRCLLAEVLFSFLHMGKSVVQTVLLSLANVVPHIVHTDEFSLPMFNAMRVVALRIPGLGAVASEVAAALAWRNPRCERALLKSLFVASSSVSADASQPLPSEFILSARAVLAMPATYFKHSTTAFESILAAVTYLAVENPPKNVNDAVYRRADFFHQFCVLLFRKMGHRVTSQISQRITKSSRVLLSLLVSVPANTSPFHRAVSSVCELLDVARCGDFELKLIDALVQVQLSIPSSRKSDASSSLASDGAPASDSALLHKLKRDCMRLLQRQDETRYEDGVHNPVAVFLLAEFDSASDALIPCAMHDNALFPPSIASFMSTSRRLVPSIATASRADAASEACALLVKYVVYAKAKERENSHRALMARVLQMLSRALGPSSGGAGAYAATPNPTPQQPSYEELVLEWNALYLVLQLLIEHFTTKVPTENAERGSCWTTYLKEEARRLEALIAQRLLWSPVLDIQILASQVYSLLVTLQKNRLPATSALVSEISSDLYRVSGNILALGSIYSLPSRPTRTMMTTMLMKKGAEQADSDQDDLLPMATSYIAGAVKKSSLTGDPCSIVVISMLCALCSMAHQHPTQVRSVVATHVVPALLRPARQVMDPLVTNLLTCLFASLPPLGTSVDADFPAQTIEQEKVDDQRSRDAGTRRRMRQGLVVLSRCLLLRAISTRRHAFSEASKDVDVLRIIHGAMRREDMIGCTSLVTLSIMQGLIGCTADSILRGSADVLCSCAEASDVAATTHDDSASRSSVVSLNANTLLSVVAALDVHRIVHFVDTATTDDARQAWAIVGWLLLQRAGEEQLVVYLREISSVLQAKPPQVSHRISMRKNPFVDGNDDDVSVAEQVQPRDASKGSGSGPPGLQGGRGGDPDDVDDFPREDMLTGNRSQRAPGAASPAEGSTTGGSAQDGSGGRISGEITAKREMLYFLWTYLDGAKVSSNSNVLSVGRVLEVVFAGVALADVFPVLVTPALLLLGRILDEFGTRNEDGGNAAGGPPVPYLHTWKMQLISGLKDVVSKAIISYRPACDVVQRLLMSNLADDNSVKRALAALLSLLAQLDNDDSEMNVTLSAAGRVILTISEGLHIAQLQNWTQSIHLAVEAIQSPAGQALLAMLCDQVTATIALANGYEPAYESSTIPLGDYSFCTIDGVVRLLCQSCESLSDLGPTARHGAGCMVSLLAAIPGAHLASLAKAGIVSKMSVAHQVVITQVAFNLLVSSASSGGALPAYVERDLLRLICSAVPTKSTRNANDVRTLIQRALPAMTLTGAKKTGQRREEQNDVSLLLLQLGIETHCEVRLVAELLNHVSVRALCNVPDSGPLWSSARLYVDALSESARDAVSRNSKAALFSLLLRVSATAGLSASGSPEASHPQQSPSPIRGSDKGSDPSLPITLSSEYIAAISEIMDNLSDADVVCTRVVRSHCTDTPTVALLVAVVTKHALLLRAQTLKGDKGTSADWWSLVDTLLEAYAGSVALEQGKEADGFSSGRTQEIITNVVRMVSTVLAQAADASRATAPSGKELDSATNVILEVSDHLPRSREYLTQTLAPMHSAELRVAIASLADLGDAGLDANDAIGFLRAFMQSYGTVGQRRAAVGSSSTQTSGIQSTEGKTAKPKLKINIASFQ